MPDSHKPPLQRWLGRKLEVSLREIIISTGAALLAILLTTVVGRLFLADSGLPFLVASMGASAVILYAVPSSPMAQPWSLVGGHLISALVGVTCARHIPDMALAAAMAAAGAVFFMHLFDCLHPPGGATALMPVAAPAAVGDLGYNYVLTPVGIDVLLMLALVVLINHYLLRRPYPHRQVLDASEIILQAPRPKTLEIGPPFNDEDLQNAMQELDTFIDVTREDLERIYAHALLQSYRRRAGKRNCRELMTPLEDSLTFADELDTALKKIHRSKLGALPVLDRAGHLAGVLSLDDFRRHAQAMPGVDDADKLQQLVTRSAAMSSDKPEAVGQVMTTPSPSVHEDQPLSAAVEILANTNAQIIPALDSNDKVVGILKRRMVLGHIGADSD